MEGGRGRMNGGAAGAGRENGGEGAVGVFCVTDNNANFLAMCGR